MLGEDWLQYHEQLQVTFPINYHIIILCTLLIRRYCLLDKIPLIRSAVLKI